MMFFRERNSVRLHCCYGATSEVARWVAARIAAIAVLVAFLGCAVIAPPAAAETSDSGGGHIPAQLQKYVVGTQAWHESPWMTSPDCRGRGGSFSLWVES